VVENLTYNYDLEIIAKKILDNIFRPVNLSKINIFLCGASINDQKKIRYFIAERLKKSKYSYIYNLIYPEDIFDELLYGNQSQDILSLENLLADSVDVIIIIPESAGSYAELATFANNERLREKIICINEIRYSKTRSFINQGPIKLIKKTNKHNVIFIDLNLVSDNFDKKLFELCSSIKQSKEQKSKENLNILQLENYILPAIFLMEPITTTEITNLVNNVIVNKDIETTHLVTVSLSILLKKNLVSSTINGYKLTKHGLEYFYNYSKHNKNIRGDYLRSKLLDQLRFEIIHLKYRNKKIKISELGTKMF
jgi:hypothetical protein